VLGSRPGAFSASLVVGLARRANNPSGQLGMAHGRLSLEADCRASQMGETRRGDELWHTADLVEAINTLSWAIKELPQLSNDAIRPHCPRRIKFLPSPRPSWRSKQSRDRRADQSEQRQFHHGDRNFAKRQSDQRDGIALRISGAAMTPAAATALVAHPTGAVTQPGTDDTELIALGEDLDACYAEFARIKATPDDELELVGVVAANDRAVTVIVQKKRARLSRRKERDWPCKEPRERTRRG
jgi:hypothetical protein